MFRLLMLLTLLPIAPLVYKFFRDNSVYSKSSAIVVDVVTHTTCDSGSHLFTPVVMVDGSNYVATLRTQTPRRPVIGSRVEVLHDDDYAICFINDYRIRLRNVILLCVIFTVELFIKLIINLF